MLVLCGTCGAGPAWPTLHGGYGLTGFVTNTLPDRPARLWRYAAGGAVTHPPVSDGERIFLAARPGRVIALDRAGTELWVREQPPIEAPLAMIGGLVVGATADGTAFAFTAVSGETAWTNALGEAVMGTATALTTPDGQHTVFLGQPTGNVHLLDAATGTRQRTVSGPARVDGSPAAAAGRLAFGSCNAAVHVLASGAEALRDVPLGEGNEVAGGVALTATQAFAGTRAGALVCVDVARGSEVWRVRPDDFELFVTPAVTADRVVFVSGGGNLVCARRADGETLWSTAHLASAFGSPVVAGNRVVATLDGKVLLFALADGEALWSYAAGDRLTGPAIVGQTVVVADAEGFVTAFGAPQPAGKGADGHE